MRLQEELKARLEQLAERQGESVSSVAQRLLEEGVRMASHPGIVFRSGPAAAARDWPEGPTWPRSSTSSSASTPRARPR